MFFCELEQTNQRDMATSEKKQKVKWDPEAERRLIDIWADILTETNGKMLSRKKKEVIATTRLNDCLKTLHFDTQYTEKAVCHKIDSVVKKGKQMYTMYQKKGETGKEYTDDTDTIDLDSAKICWPNFETFYDRFKDHPSLGPGNVDESCTPVREEVVITEGDSEVLDCSKEHSTPSTSRCPSWSSNKGEWDDDIPDDDSHNYEDDIQFDEEDDEIVPSKKKKVEKGKSKMTARVGKKKNAPQTAVALQFIGAIAEMQEGAQARQIEHERKLQQDAHAFQQKMEQERVKFEAQLSSTLQQQNNQFQLNLFQQNQVFQAELLKKLFEKSDSDK